MEKITPLLSIIVPVYNVGQYLARCVNSILAQTFADFELILIDDGSTDCCGKFCDEYAVRDNRVRVFHRSNQGVSATRNFGLQQAKSEYVTFIDADDAISPEALQVNMSILLSNPEIDILQYPYSRVAEDGSVISYASEKPKIYTDKKEIFRDLVYDGPITWTSWAKIYKKNAYKIFRFYEKMSVNEDLYALVAIIDNVNCLYLSNAGNYMYYYRKGSACDSGFSPLKSLDFTRTSVLIFQAAVKYNIDVVEFWESAVKSCINTWSYYGSCMELKNYLELLGRNDEGMKSKNKANRMIRCSRLLSPLIVARIARFKWLLTRILRPNNPDLVRNC